MRTKFLIPFLAIALLTVVTSCEKEEESSNTANFNLNITGLEDLGSTANYEGWLILDDGPVSTGVFSVNSNGQLSQNSFEVNRGDLNTASTFVLTIEPSPDNDPAPSDVHILAGDFNGNSASLSIDHGAALNTALANSAGSYILATPTDGADTNENSGIWFLDLSSGSPSVGLELDQLPEGWAYEGWVVVDGIPVSTGTFRNVDDFDNDDSFSGNQGGPPYPGEDFLINAPAGLSFPTDLRGATAVISIEPVPDNSPAPFTLKPLVGGIPEDAIDHSNYSMDQNLVFPTGVITR